MPFARIAVMGPAGREYVYKDEIQGIQKRFNEARAKGANVEEANKERDAALAKLSQKYERELMNPREALSLGSISEIVMPDDLRAVLARNLDALLRSYTPGPMTGPQREFH